MSGYEFTMSLGVRHPDMDPSRITQALGLQPRHIWRSGDERLDSAGAALGGNHRGSYWLCELPPREKLTGERIALKSELSRVLDTLRRSIDFMQELQRGGGAVELFVSVYLRGEIDIVLLPEESAALGRLGVAVTIEIKPYLMAPTSESGSA
jgi:hypothetical protein